MIVTTDRLSTEQKFERDSLLQLHRELTNSLKDLAELRLSRPGFEDMIDAYSRLASITAEAACEAAIAIEMQAIAISAE